MKENTINFKEKLNNKLNLPTTWTKKKMASLFLMTWLSVNGVEAGQGFKSCLASHNDDTSYNGLLNFGFANNVDINNGKVLSVCCNSSSQCSSSLWTSTCNSGSYKFFCVKVSQLIACGKERVECNGIIGDALITGNTTVGKCPSGITTIDNYLKTIVPVEIENIYVYWHCLDGSPCSGLECSWDNGGLTCYSYLINELVSNNCYLQWPTPFPKGLDTTTTSLVEKPTTTTQQIVSTVTTNSLPSDDNNPYLTEKITIPIGTVVGVIAIGGTTYLICKKRKKKNNSQSKEQLIELKNLPELPEEEKDNYQQLEISAHEVVPNFPQIQQELLEDNQQLKAEIARLKRESVEREISAKKSEWNNLFNSVKNKLNESNQELLNDLLETQEELLKNTTGEFARKQFEKTKSRLSKQLTSEEIEEILNKQKEVKELEQKINEARGQELEAQIQIPPK